MNLMKTKKLNGISKVKKFKIAKDAKLCPHIHNSVLEIYLNLLDSKLVKF